MKLGYKSRVLLDLLLTSGLDILEFATFPTKHLSCVGGSFFSSPEKPMMSVTENNFRFMLESFDRFVDTYMNIIEMRKDDPYTAEDLAAQDAMRRNWLEDQLFSDVYTTNVTAYEGWSFSNLPPEVKF